MQKKQTIKQSEREEMENKNARRPEMVGNLLDEIKELIVTREKESSLPMTLFGDASFFALYEAETIDQALLELSETHLVDKLNGCALNKEYLDNLELIKEHTLFEMNDKMIWEVIEKIAQLKAPYKVGEEVLFGKIGNGWGIYVHTKHLDNGSVSKLVSLLNNHPELVPIRRASFGILVKVKDVVEPTNEKEDTKMNGLLKRIEELEQNINQLNDKMGFTGHSGVPNPGNQGQPGMFIGGATYGVGQENYQPNASFNFGDRPTIGGLNNQQQSFNQPNNFGPRQQPNFNAFGERPEQFEVVFDASGSSHQQVVLSSLSISGWKVINQRLFAGKVTYTLSRGTMGW